MCKLNYKDIQNTTHLSFKWRPVGKDANTRQSFMIPPNTDFNNISKNCVFTLRSVLMGNFDRHFYSDTQVVKDLKSFGIRFTGLGLRSQVISLTDKTDPTQSGYFNDIILFDNTLGQHNSLKNSIYSSAQSQVSMRQYIGNSNIDITSPCSNPFGKSIELEVVSINPATGNITPLILPNNNSTNFGGIGASAARAAGEQIQISINFDITFVEPAIDQNSPP